MPDTSSLTIKEANELLKTKKVKAQELAESYLDKANRLNKKLNSYITISDEIAIDQAKKVDKLIAEGQPISPLAGIPIALKDLFSTKDIKTTAGSKVLEN